MKQNKKQDFTKVKFVKNKNHVKDPVRFPKVIDKIENESKKDFNTSLELTLKYLHSEMQKMVK